MPVCNQVSGREVGLGQRSGAREGPAAAGANYFLSVGWQQRRRRTGKGIHVIRRCTVPDERFKHLRFAEYSLIKGCLYIGQVMETMTQGMVLNEKLSGQRRIGIEGDLGR